MRSEKEIKDRIQLIRNLYEKSEIEKDQGEMLSEILALSWTLQPSQEELPLTVHEIRKLRQLISRDYEGA